MKLAIALPLWNRIEFVRETIPALKAARGFSDIPVVAALDGPLKDIPGHMRETYRRGDIAAVRKFVLDALLPYHSADVFSWERSENVGMSDNIMSAVNKAFLLYNADAVICVEEDVLVSRDFITFMRACLERYKDTKSVMAVTADCEWCGPDSQSNPCTVVGSPWWVTIGWAIWRDRWEKCYPAYKEFMADPKVWADKMHDRIVSVYPPMSHWQICRPLFLLEKGNEIRIDRVAENSWGGMMNAFRVANQQVIVEPRAARATHIGWYGRNMNFELASKVGSTKERPWRAAACFRVDWETEKLAMEFPSDEELEHKGKFQGLA